MNIRPREERDLPACAAVLKEVHAQDGYPVEGVDDPIGWLTPPRLTAAWVAELGGQVVGHVLVSEPDGEEAVRLWRERSAQPVEVLARLFVLPAARGIQVGEQLTKAAMARAQGLSQRLVLDVMEKDRAATRLYERMGWSSLGSISHAVGEIRIAARAYVSPG